MAGFLTGSTAILANHENNEFEKSAKKTEKSSSFYGWNAYNCMPKKSFYIVSYNIKWV